MQKNLVGKSEQGFGLLEIIIAAGLLALIVAVMNQNIVISINSQRSVELRGDKEDVKRRLVEFHDCNQTLTAVPSSICTGVGVRIDLKDRKGNTLIPKDGKLIGKWTYVPECGTTNSAVNVRAVHFKDNVNLQTPNLNQDDKYVKDPMTKKTIRIDQDASFMFQSGAELCSQRNKKLVPFQGTYKSGTTTQKIDGVPKFVMIFDPSDTAIHAYCMKTADMQLPDDHLCGSGSDMLKDSTIKFGLSDFTVGGAISKTNASGNAFRDFVYFGFMEVED
ncbi:MAG: hypothetical protein NTY08_09895 [Proteobacteria bacterium]|nr:hypothetical protein [Pseudomonadota bacterium]